MVAKSELFLLAVTSPSSPTTPSTRPRQSETHDCAEDRRARSRWEL